MEDKKYIKYKLDRVFTTNVMVEVNEDVDKDVVDSLIFTQFLNMEGELEDSYWRPHYSQNSFSSEEIDFDDDVEKSLKCKVGVVNISKSTFESLVTRFTTPEYSWIINDMILYQ